MTAKLKRNNKTKDQNAQLVSYSEADWWPVQLNEARCYVFVSSEVENPPRRATGR